MYVHVPESPKYGNGQLNILIKNGISEVGNSNLPHNSYDNVSLNMDRIIMMSSSVQLTVHSSICPSTSSSSLSSSLA